MSNEKVMIINLIVGLIRNTLLKMVQYFLKQFESFGGNINVKLDWGVDTSKLSAKFDLASLKPETDVDKTVPVDLSKLSNVVNNDIVNKTMYDKLVAKVSIDATGFILKTKYDTNKSYLEKKILDASGLVKK